MPEYVDPNTVVSFALGTIPTTDWVSTVNDNDDTQNFSGIGVAGMPVCISHLAASTAVANATHTRLQLSTAGALAYDPLSMINSTTDIITLPYHGKYLIGAYIQWDYEGTQAGSRLIGVRQGSSGVIIAPSNTQLTGQSSGYAVCELGRYNTIQYFTKILEVDSTGSNHGDSIAFYGYQDWGASRNYLEFNAWALYLGDA